MENALGLSGGQATLPSRLYLDRLRANLTTFAVGPEFQLAPAVSLLKKFEARGVVPGPNAVVENEDAEHGIFEVPAEDERQL